MDDEELKILTKYISAWSWQIIGIILFGVIIVVLSNILNEYTFVVVGILTIFFVIVQYLALKRKREVFNNE